MGSNGQAPRLLYCAPAMKHSPQWRRLALAAAACALLASCVYKVTVFQGSIVDPGDVEKMELGMTREQVAYLLGTPTVRDPFQADRWDYVFTKGTLEGKRQLVVIRFSDDGVSSIDTTTAPED